MELYIDTANLDEIKQANDLGVLDGVTTNPSLIAKEKVDYGKRLAEICGIVKGPVSAEVAAAALAPAPAAAHAPIRSTADLMSLVLHGIYRLAH